MQMSDEQLKAVGAALYVILGAHDAGEEALNLALSIAGDQGLPVEPLSILPYVPPLPTLSFPQAKDFVDAAAMQAYLRAHARDLIARAHACGAKIEIGLDSPAPYAMGNHRERVDVRAIPDNSIEDPRSRRAF
jgi:hypothetical protein